MTSLRRLALADSHWEAPLDASWATDGAWAATLEEVDLSFNPLGGDVPAEWQGFSRLRKLRVRWGRKGSGRRGGRG